MTADLTSSTPSTPIHAPRLHHKVALITGSSSGLGRAVALAYASHGTKLVVCADLQSSPRPGIDGETTPTHEDICRRYGDGKALFVKCDVGSSDQVKSTVQLAVDNGGRLDIIVNNAGIGVEDTAVRLHELEADVWERCMRINSTGVYHGCKWALAQMVRQPLDERGHRGYIVNVSSMLGHVGLTRGAGAYCASKGAVMNLTRSIALDYAKDRIHCNALCPGFTKTAQTKPNFEDKTINLEMIAKTPWGAWGQVEEVARGAVFLASEDAAFVTGIGLPVDGGYLAQ